ncbi:hypothetical protein [uncultured Fibrobacter sp.]|uniref:hypothetical protein n=1 Tax=uncultured Fibrobacter sp. TaxID=261512 RepID=UPI00261E7F42|nr:hypothetical protein [uncultured Fibrobacter sp.]
MALNNQATTTKKIQATTEINKLITRAQTAPTPEAYEREIQALWTIFGENFTALVAKNSYLIDSDFSLRGYSPAERQSYQAGTAYMLFCKAVSDFEPSRKVPFAAYIAKIGEWRMRDEKRKNAKRSKREELDRCTSNSDSDEESYSRIDNCDVNPFTGERNELDCDFDKKDLLVRFKKRLAARDPKALNRFNIMYELCREGNYSDAEAARRIGCERANMKNVKSNLLQIMTECGLKEEFRLLMAA